MFCSEYHCAECHDFVVMQDAIMLSVVMLSVVMLDAAAPLMMAKSSEKHFKAIVFNGPKTFIFN
jgi:hypothetical protein